MKSYQFYVHDYLRDTVHLSELEDLIYRRLLDWYHINEQPLPLSHTACARIAAINPNDENRMKCIKNVIDAFFVERDYGWLHERAQDSVDRFLVWKEGERLKKEAESLKAQAGATRSRNYRMRKKALQSTQILNAEGVGQTLH